MRKKKQAIANQPKIQQVVKKIKEHSLTNIKHPNDPEKLLDELEKIITKHERSAGSKKKESQEEVFNLASKLTILGELDNHRALADGVGDKFQPLIIEFSNQLICEYECKTASEKALVEMIASAYVRTLEYTEILHLCITDQRISHELNGLCAILSKEVDRANRHFITGLSTLKQIKAPEFKVSIKTHNAFLAQNQQVNASKNEIN